MKLHEILSQGEGLSLGPVTIDKIPFAASGDGTKRNLLLNVSDSTGKADVKIWGPAANANLKEGDVITITGSGPKGGLKTSEWKGRISINANNCQIITSEGAVQAPASQNSGYVQRTSSSQSSGTLSVDQMADMIVENATIVLSKAEAKGLPPEVAIQLAINANQTMALFWFGEKYPGKGA